MDKDRFSIGNIARAAQGIGDYDKARVAHEAMMQVNSAEQAIRLTAERLRARADEVLRQLDGGGTVYEISVASLGEDLNRAIERRAQAFKFLSAVLSEDQVKQAMTLD